MTQSRTAGSEGFDFIDALRGLAAVTVFIYHAFVHVLWAQPAESIPSGTFAWHAIHHDFNLGRFGVSIFFLVSGFLIPATLRKPGATLRTFAIHRAFRLYPAYWLSIALYAACNLAVRGEPGAPPRTLLVNLTMAQKFVGVPDFIGAFWTLQIELILYVLCGLLFACGWLQYRRTALTISCLTMVAVGWARQATNHALPVAVPLALTLMAFADLTRAYHLGECSGRGLAEWATAVAAALVPTCLWAYGDFGWGAILSNWGAIATFLICYASRRAFTERAALRRVGKFFGDISYSFYLLGASIGLELAGWLYEVTRSFPVTVAVDFGAVTLMSLLAYKYIERPGLRFGRTLGRPVRLACQDEASARGGIRSARRVRPTVRPPRPPLSSPPALPMMDAGR